MSDRPSPIAGTWYSGNAASLAREIAGYLEKAACDKPAGKIVGVVVPHAGYQYSGRTAAYAFRLLTGLRPRLVAVVSPFHRVHPARLLTSAFTAYSTPLGRIVVERDALRQVNGFLHRSLGIDLFPLVDDEEHSLEIELPFLQHVLGHFELLPIMMRDQSSSTARALGDALADALSGSQALLVASSDLSHFHSERRAAALDRELLRRLGSFDPQGILDGEEEGTAYACGRGAIAATLWAAKKMGADRVTILHRSSSGETSGDTDSVVGYGAAVIWRSR